MLEPISREDINRLREELDSLKPSDAQSPQNLVESMNKLQDVLEKLVTLLESANKEIMDEYAKGLHDSSEKINTLIQQNEKIARGVVALADLMKKQEVKPTPVLPTPVAQVSMPAIPMEQTNTIPVPINTAPPVFTTPVVAAPTITPSQSAVATTFTFSQQPVSQALPSVPTMPPPPIPVPPMTMLQQAIPVPPVAVPQQVIPVPNMAQPMAAIPLVPPPLPVPPMVVMQQVAAPQVPSVMQDAQEKPVEPKRRSLLEKFSFK